MCIIIGVQLCHFSNFLRFGRLTFELKSRSHQGPVENYAPHSLLRLFGLGWQRGWFLRRNVRQCSSRPRLHGPRFTQGVRCSHWGHEGGAWTVKPDWILTQERVQPLAGSGSKVLGLGKEEGKEGWRNWTLTWTYIPFCLLTTDELKPILKKSKQF